MTIATTAMRDGGPPPTARLVATFAGGNPEDYAMPGTALHLVYGIGAGAVFAVGVPPIGRDLGSIAVAVGPGLVYGIVAFGSLSDAPQRSGRVAHDDNG